MVILINNHKQREAEKKWEKENARLYLKEKQAQGYQELQRKRMRLPAADKAEAKHRSQSELTGKPAAWQPSVAELRELAMIDDPVRRKEMSEAQKLSLRETIQRFNNMCYSKKASN